MTGRPAGFPAKTREVRNHHMDSTVWNDFAYRAGDVVIGTWAKAGTTWTQQIVGQLLLGPDPGLRAAELSPWLDLRVLPRTEILAMLEAQQHRRFIKTHLPLDALPFSDAARYIYVGRDARDVVWSLFNHHHNFNDEAYRAFNETPGLIGPPLPRPPSDIRRYWREWIEGDGYPFWSFWDNVRTWWDARNQPNVMLLHFNELKADMEGRMRDIAAFLDIPIDPEKWPEIVRYCTFEWMQAHSHITAGGADLIFTGGSRAFIYKGTNGRWQDALSPRECAEYEALAIRRLGAECAGWLINGATRGPTASPRSRARPRPDRLRG